MATEQPRFKAADETPETSKTPAGGPAKTQWRRLAAKRWFVVLAIGLLAVPIAGFVCLRPKPVPPPAVPPKEITLGAFQFTGGKGQDCCIADARFALAITLLSQIDDAARETLAARRLRVQQGVEQLLRSAHSADFDDPSLGELKRQMREQIDQTLGMKAVSEIIITDLKVRQNDRASTPAAASPVSVTADSY